MRYQSLKSGRTLKVTPYHCAGDVEELRHVFDNDALVSIARKLHDRCRQAHGGAFDRRTISGGWVRAFDRLWIAMYQQGACNYGEYLRFTGQDESRMGKRGRYAHSL